MTCSGWNSSTSRRVISRSSVEVTARRGRGVARRGRTARNGDGAIERAARRGGGIARFRLFDLTVFAAFILFYRDSLTFSVSQTLVSLPYIGKRTFITFACSDYHLPHSLFRLADQMVYHGFHVAGLMVHA